MGDFEISYAKSIAILLSSESYFLIVLKAINPMDAYIPIFLNNPPNICCFTLNFFIKSLEPAIIAPKGKQSPLLRLTVTVSTFFVSYFGSTP